MLLVGLYQDAHKDFAAFDLLQKLVNEGFVEANMDLAVCYIDGLGTQKDHQKARQLMEEALRSQKIDASMKESIQTMLTDLNNGRFGTDSSYNSSVNGGNISHTDSGVTYRPLDNGSNKNGGCYIATCVYGSYDCPAVWVLRRFRDDKLAATRMGRLFIKCYYAISPALVKKFGGKDWFRNTWKALLDPFIDKLKKEGFSDHRYQDRRWDS